MSEHADVLYEFLLENASEDEDGRLICREPLYPVLMQRFGLTDPEARRARTKAVRELTAAGKVQRVGVRSVAVVVSKQRRLEPSWTVRAEQPPLGQDRDWYYDSRNSQPVRRPFAAGVTVTRSSTAPHGAASPQRRQHLSGRAREAAVAVWTPVPDGDAPGPEPSVERLPPTVALEVTERRRLAARRLLAVCDRAGRRTVTLGESRAPQGAT